MGVVHGDVSPDNVLLDLEGRPFLADLGVARIVGERPGELRGTEGFVAPEVAAGGVPSTAADTYALGALAWFCLTGEAPGPAVIRGRLGERVPGLPSDLIAAVEGALRTRPEDRPEADALAVAIFDSAEAEPLVLVRGGDDVSLLTRRIRAAARAEAGHAGPGTVSAPAHRRARDAARRHVSTAATVTRATSTVVRGMRTLAPFVAVAGIMTALALGVLAWSGGRDDARASTSAAPTDAGAGASSASGTPGPAGTSGVSDSAAAAPAGSGAADVRLRRDAPRTDPMGLVRALAQARAAAWSSGIATRLIEVDAPRSPALARDTETLAGVQRANQRYVGLTFTVREASFVGESEGVTTIRTRIDTGAHVVRGPSGDQRRPAVRAAAVLLDLVRTDSGWRVHDVRAAQA